MLRNIIFFILLSGLICYTAFAATEEEDTLKKIKIPPGMTIKKVGKINVLVPEDSELQQQDQFVIVEGSSEYTARKLLEINEHLAKNDLELKAIKDEIEQLKKVVVKDTKN